MLIAAVDEDMHMRCCGGRLRDDACCGLRRCRSEEDIMLQSVVLVCGLSRGGGRKLRMQLKIIPGINVIFFL